MTARLITDSDFNPSCPLILPLMASVFHSLGQILCGEEGEPTAPTAIASNLNEVLRGGLPQSRVNATDCYLSLANSPSSLAVKDLHRLPCLG